MNGAIRHSHKTPVLENILRMAAASSRMAITSIPFSIGRDEEADLRVDSRRVSRRHAVINCEGGDYSIDDLTARTEPSSTASGFPTRRSRAVTS